MGNLIKGSYKEIDIEDFIWKEIATGKLQKRGLETSGAMYFRQLEMPGCGVMDIVSLSMGYYMSNGQKVKNIHIQVYELKRGTVCCNDVGQLARYISGFKRNWEDIKDSFCPNDNYDLWISGVLIGPDIERDALCLAMELFACEVVTFDVCWNDGLVFTRRDALDIRMPIDTSKLLSRTNKGTFSTIARHFFRGKSRQVSLPF